MSNDWEKELEEMKTEATKKIEDLWKKEEGIKERYKGDAERILNIIHVQCKSVVKVLADQSAKSSMDDLAKIVSLEVPIVIDISHIKRTIVFRLVLTNSGYAVEFVKIFQDIDTGQISEIVGDYINPPVTQEKIYPPVTQEKIQNVIRKFLRDRNIEIERLIEKRKLSMR
jgi:hypothetical protein